MPFTALTDPQEHRLAQLESFRAMRRRIVIASVEARSSVLLADALTARAPHTRKQARQQTGLLQAKVRALVDANEHLGAARFADMVIRRATDELFPV